MFVDCFVSEHATVCNVSLPGAEHWEESQLDITFLGGITAKYLETQLPMVLIPRIMCGFFECNPMCSMYGIFTNICPINDPNVGKYTIHGAYGN